MAKKKRIKGEAEQVNEPHDEETANGDDHEMKILKKEKKRKTEKEEHQERAIIPVTIAVPGSIIDNAQSPELATRLAGQIARAATIFRINEGLLPPLDAPHHLRKQEWGPYREGITLSDVERCGLHGSDASRECVQQVQHVVVDQVLEPGKRVTVAMGTNRNMDAGLSRHVVSLSKPREEGMYWGYQVRYANNLSSVFRDCPYKGGYDYVIGTSEHGQIVNSSDLKIPSFRHLLMAFGGLAGLEECIEEDDNLKGKNVQDVFCLYLNTCPHQGSRTIRTEYFQEPVIRALRS